MFDFTSASITLIVVLYLWSSADVIGLHEVRPDDSFIERNLWFQLVTLLMQSHFHQYWCGSKYECAGLSISISIGSISNGMLACKVPHIGLFCY